jgi:hypothetical protein
MTTNEDRAPRSASPNCRTLYLTPPAMDHPLYPLFARHNALRELEIEMDLRMERIAPTPRTLAEPDRESALTGLDRETFRDALARRDAYSHAAYLIHDGLMAVIDNLGGM